MLGNLFLKARPRIGAAVASLLLHEGVEGRGLFMIGRGFVKITVQGQLKELLAHPDFFGEQTLVTDHPAA